MGTSSPADFEAVLRGDAQTGYQLASLVAFPAYVAFTLFRKRGFNLNRTLRATWLAGVGGAGAGAGYGWYESTKGDNYLRERHIALIYDTRRIRTNDHSLIGAALFGILTPAIFWRRARVVHLVLGGAGVGSSIGLATYAYRELTKSHSSAHRPIIVSPPTPPASYSASVEPSEGRER